MADYRDRNKIITLKGQNKDFSKYYAMQGDAGLPQEEAINSLSQLQLCDISTSDITPLIDTYMYTGDNPTNIEYNYKCVKHKESNPYLSLSEISIELYGDSLYINTFSGSTFNNTTFRVCGFVPMSSIPDNKYLRYLDVLYYNNVYGNGDGNKDHSYSTIMYLTNNIIMPQPMDTYPNWINNTYLLGSLFNLHYISNQFGWTDYLALGMQSYVFERGFYSDYWKLRRSYWIGIYKVTGTLKSGQSGLTNLYDWNTDIGTKGMFKNVTTNVLNASTDSEFISKFVNIIRGVMISFRTKYNNELGGITSTEFSLSYFTTQFNNIDISNHEGFYVSRDDYYMTPMLGLHMKLNTSSISTKYDYLNVTFFILPYNIAVYPDIDSYSTYKANIPDYPFICINWKQVYHGVSNLTITHNYCENITIDIDYIRSDFPIVFNVYRYRDDLLASDLIAKTIRVPNNSTDFNTLVKQATGEQTYYYFASDTGSYG